MENYVKGKKILYGQKYNADYDVVLATNDTIQFLKDMPDSSASLVVTSPPYNIGKIYEKKTEFDKYLKWQNDVGKECYRILNNHGSLCWEVGNYIENGEVFPLDYFFYQCFKNVGLKLRNRIIWQIGHGLHASKRFSGRYETILWFTKTDDYVFNLDSVRIPQKYPGKRSYTGSSKGIPSCNPLGKNPEDIWKFVIEDWEREIWEIPNVKSNHPEKTIHPAQYPIELVERLVLALTDEKDTVFDPFVGVGSSLIAAILHNRKAVGVDKESQYTDIAYDRIIQTLNGNLRKRQLGKPVFVPTGKEKVAKIPEEWKTKELFKF